MKKVYALIVGCVFYAYPAISQTFYWIGPANGTWSSGANWSLTEGGSPAGNYPQDAADNALFTTSATVQFNTTIDLNSLAVTGTSSNVQITGVGGVDRVITLHSTSAANPALDIAAGCVLEHSAVTDTWFRVIFGEDAIAEVDGDWYFTGDVNDNAIASFYLGEAGFTTRLNVNPGGSITIGSSGYIEPNETTADQYLVFDNGSRLRLLGNGPVVPAANYAAASAIDITGVVDAGVVFEETGAVGTINYNNAAQANGSNPLYLSLLAFSVEGDVNILNTNDNELALISFNTTVGMPTRDAIIKGDLNIQGQSRVVVAHNDGVEYANNLYVEGDVIMNGTGLGIHTGNFITSQPTTLYVKGNILHTSGTISAASTSVNESAHLYVIEMNGNVAQTINSSTGSFDNAQNQVTLRINNAVGVTLQSDLQVGRLSFNTANKGIVHTGTNVLTVNNATSASASTLPVESPGTTGYVNGTLRRRTASAEPVFFPVGSASLYRGATIIPASSAASTFEVNYVHSAHGGNLQAPVRGIADYYWNINRVGSGADAAIQLNIPGALPGALVGYDIAVTRYNGTHWISTRGTTGTVVSPGTSTSGTVRSANQSTFGLFTLSLESEAALPTYLLAFEVRHGEKESAELEWRVTDNSTPEKFEVLRSADGSRFETIGSVTPLENSRTYRFSDPQLLPGNNYYRLRMTDKDGTVTFSMIRLLARNMDGVHVHDLVPSLVHDRTRMRVSSSGNRTLQLLITDATGRAVMKQQANIQAGTQDIWLNVSHLKAGIYQVTTFGAGGKALTLRFIKQ